MKEHRWSENARIVLTERYLLRDDSGRTTETPDQLLWRVARSIADVEKSIHRRRWAQRFYELMASGDFLPNSPTLMNAGRENGQLAACFVIPIEDSLDSIFDALKYAAKIHQSGGGTGFSFSRLRGKGSEVSTSHGVAGGPLAFLQIFDQSTEAIKQGGVRRGANMGVLRVDHPDILEFIDIKRDQTSITNFNLSVGVTGAFFDALAKGRKVELRCPHSGRAVRSVAAQEIFDRIVDSAWKCGDPGLLFLDRMNLFNPTPTRGAFEATNPCGEQPLLGYEACNLGSINLGNFVGPSGIEWQRLADAVHLAIRFLDDVIDANHYPLLESEAITRRNRKVGLGVMGFADLLLALGIPYGAPEAEQLGETLMAWVDRHAKTASAQLALERGAFEGFARSLWARLGYPKLRNATVSTVAPTGTISLLLGASSGIEPIFAAHLRRNVLGGKRLTELHPAVEKALRQKGVGDLNVSEDSIGQRLGAAWRPARVLSIEEHLYTQAAFQRHSDSAVSKTVNLPESASRQDVARAYLLAHQLGCKGITVYRDKSRSSQVLEQAAPGAVCDLCVD
ncbi:MAG: adenosylcobalamin-dependent ribonucleoside-diphosphate reductase [Oligoflexia bacterium]